MDQLSAKLTGTRTRPAAFALPLLAGLNFHLRAASIAARSRSRLRLDFSTVTLRISEVSVITDTNFFGKLMAIIHDSWVAAGDVVLYLIATVIVLSPLALIVATIVWYWRKRRKPRPPEQP